MKRWLPYPVFALLLLAAWLLMNETLAAGHVILGTALALGGTLVYAELQAPMGRVHRFATMLALLWFVLEDVVRSNIAVARIVLGVGGRNRVSAFIELPLEVRHPAALAVLACIITATPGTSWARYERARNVLTIHVLDLLDEDEWIRTFKRHYERRLLEIFE